MTQIDNSPILKEILELKAEIGQVSKSLALRSQWMPKADVMDFLGFAPTQMATITRKYNLQTTTIGKRKFYLVESLLKALENEKK